MKKVTFILFIVFACCIQHAFTQTAPVCTVGTVISQGPTAAVPVTVTGYTNITGFDLKLLYNSTYGTATSVTLGPGMAGTLTPNLSTAGVIILSYFDVTAASLADNSTIFTLNFSRTAVGLSPVTWDSDPLENTFYDAAYAPLTDSPLNPGSFKFQGAPIIHADPFITACPNGTVTVPIFVTDFYKIATLSHKLTYNTSVLTLTGITLGSLSLFETALYSGSTPGSVTFGGFSNPTDLNGITLPDNTVLLTLTFTYIGTPGATSPLTWINDVTYGKYYSPPFGSYLLIDAPNANYYYDGSVTSAAVLLSGSTTQTNVSCYGLSNGSVTVTGAGGTSPYEYRMGAGAYQVSGTFGSLASGSYTFNVKDANGCATSDITVIITQPAAALEISATPSQILCFGGTGSVTLGASGGTTPYTFSGDLTSGLVAGTYNYTVTDANGCAASTTATINAAPALLELTSTPTQPLCFGQTGSVSLNISGGTAPFTYDPSNPATSGLAAGSYTYWVNDANGCTASSTAVINAAPSLLVLNNTVTQPLCYGQLGSVALNASGGTGAYTYTGGQNQNNLAAGSYEFTVTDANGCTATTAATIDAAPALLVLTPTVTQPLCFGQLGSVVLNASGGTLAYTYTGGQNQNSLAAGPYVFTVTDANGCSATTPVTIDAAPTELVLSNTVTQPLCYGELGSVSLSATGGTGAYTYTGGQVQNNLAAGPYTFTVTDANGCTATSSATVNAAPDLLVLGTTVTQPLCFGQLGSVSLLATGGTAAYTYAGGQNYTNLAPGTYNYTVTDANGCTATTSVTINAVPTLLVLTNTITQPLCNGQLGIAALSASGGTLPYTYTGGQNQINLTAGPYTFTVTDANGCTATSTATVNAAPSAIVFTATVTQPACFGQLGTITLNVSGGIPFYTYIGANNPIIANLSAGTYTYGVIDANGCQASVTATVNAAPSALLFTATPINPACYGQTGSVTLDVTGGTPPYTYNGGLNPPVIGLGNGTYTYYVSDANGCQTSANATIVVPTLLVLTATPTQPLCFGQTGSVALSATGGTAAYTYTGLGNPATSGLGAGSYTYWVQDAQGCMASATVAINAAPSQLVLTATPTQPLCFGQTGSVALSTAGGTSPYTYSINNPATTGLTGGSYTYWVTDNNGCQASASATIVVPTAVELTVTPTQPLCFGQTGSVALSTAGGTAPYTYSPTNPATSGLTAGSYTYLVTDQNGCTDSETITINAAPALLVLTATPTQPLCFGQTGSVALSTVGGTVAYTYSPSNPATTGLAAGSYTYWVSDNNGCQASATAVINAAPSQLILTATPTQPLCFGQTGSVALSTTGGTAAYTYSVNNPPTSGLSGGTYTYWVTDNNGCQASATAVINAIPTLLVLTATPTQPSCFGQTGSVALSTAGGTSPYTYSPSNPALSGLAAGSYTYWVLDANGCPASMTVVINAAPALLVLTATATQPNCFGQTGSVALSTVGGTSPYTYSPTNPATTGLTAGTYTYFVTDSKGCTASGSATIVVPTAVVLTATATQPACFGQTGSVALSTTGGTPAYTYSPTNPATSGLTAGSYTYLVTDSKGCTDSKTVVINAAPTQLVLTATPTQPLCFGQTGSVALSTAGGTAAYTYSPSNPATSGLGAGSYTYWVTDQNGCQTSASVVINAAPSPIVFTATPTQPPCYGMLGSITLNISGGIPNYTYIGFDNPIIGNLSPGIYTYWVVDANGCQASATATIIMPTPVVVTATPTQPFCYGQTGSVTLNTSGGTPAYTYSPTNPPTSGLAAGTYSYLVSDANGCTANTSATIVMPTAVVLTATATQPSCFGQTGSVALSTAGGTSPYTYSVSNPATTGLGAGTYTYWVNDFNGCQASASVVIDAAPALLVLTGTPAQPLCFGQTGSVVLSSTGGTAPYTYSQSNPALTGLTAGSYTYWVTDSKGCQASGSVVINAAPSALLFTATPTQPLCFGQVGSVVLNVTGGTPAYTYNGALNPPTINLGAGTYTYYVSDANGCQTSANATIIVPTAVVLTITPTQPACFGQTGSVALSTAGGTPAYTYSLSNPATSGLAAGTYTYYVSDANGCTASNSVIINAAPSQLTISGTPTQPLCFGQTGSVALTSAGGTAPRTYNAGNPATTGLTGGTYTYWVTDNNGCQASTSVVINAAPALLVITATPTQPGCFGQTGSVALSTSGGTAAYTYNPSNPATSALAAGSYTYWVTDANGCQASTTVVINAAPALLVLTATPTNPTCFGLTGSVTLNTSGGTSPYTYNVSNPPTTGLGAGTYTYWVTDLNGCQASASATIVVPAAITFSGNVQYYSTTGTYQNGVDVTLQQGGVDIISVSTDASGNYSFPNVCAGTYDVVLTSAAVSGGVNATDAAQVSFYKTFPNWLLSPIFSSIEKVRLYAGDVITDQTLGSNDAGRILAYYVTAGIPTWSTRATWTFWPKNDLISANPVAGGSSVVLYSINIASSTTKDFWALCTGDFNRDFDVVKSSNEKLHLTYDQTRKVNTGTDFDLPVIVKNTMKVGAMSVALNFPMDKIEVRDVIMNNSSTQAMFNVNGNELRIGWYSLTPIDVKAGETLFTLKLRSIGSTTNNDAIRFSLAADPMNEIADADYSVINDANLNIDMLNISSTTIPGTLSSSMKLNSIPNPFRDNLNLNYTLPEDGTVSIDIYNMLGEKVKTLVNEMQTAGNQNLKIDSRILLPGVYTLTLQLKTSSQVLTQTIKIVCN